MAAVVQAPTEAAALYEARKIAGACTYASSKPCPRSPEDGAQLCRHHLHRERRRKRLSARRLRQERRDAGRCAEGCGAKSETYRCAACAIRLNRIPPSAGVPAGVDKPAEDRAWRAGTHESDATTKRYRGRARRGKPPAARTDDEDLRYAVEAIEQSRKALAYAYSPAVAQLPRIQREAAKRAALAHVGHANRFLDELLERHKIAR